MPTVASYCTTFLKPEMLHIYRQVTGLKRYGTFIMTRDRQCEDRYPFPDIELAQKRRYGSNFIRRYYLKHVRKLPPIYYRGELMWLSKIVGRRQPDLMHIYFGHTGVHLLPFIKGWDRPCVVSFHGMDVQTRADRPEYEVKLRELLQVAPLVLARSRSLIARLLALGCPEERIRLNRTGIPLELYPYEARPEPEDGAWHFVQACRLIQKKGIGTALRAFAAFRKKHPRAVFTVAGEGPMLEELQKLASALGIARAVTFPGFLDQGGLRDLYSRAHVFVHPSQMTEDQNQEGVPNAMLEAMSTGLPVLATWHGGIPEAVRDRETGFLVAERDHAELADRMETLCGTPGLAARMGEAASRSVAEEFEQGRQIEKLESYYDEAVRLGPRPASAHPFVIERKLEERPDEEEEAFDRDEVR